MRSGRAHNIPIVIRIMALMHTIENEVFIMRVASVSFLRPLYIENKGTPPPPKRLANAVIITINGKHIPTAPMAAVPTSGIRAI